MADVTNLNRFRKRKAREDARRAADENAVRFGRSGAQKRAEKAEAETARRRIDGHRRDETDAQGDGPDT